MVLEGFLGNSHRADSQQKLSLTHINRFWRWRPFLHSRLFLSIHLLYYIWLSLCCSISGKFDAKLRVLLLFVWGFLFVSLLPSDTQLPLEGLGKGYTSSLRTPSTSCLGCQTHLETLPPSTLKDKKKKTSACGFVLNLPPPRFSAASPPHPSSSLLRIWLWMCFITSSPNCPHLRFAAPLNSVHPHHETDQTQPQLMRTTQI